MQNYSVIPPPSPIRHLIYSTSAPDFSRRSLMIEDNLLPIADEQVFDPSRLIGNVLDSPLLVKLPSSNTTSLSHQQQQVACSCEDCVSADLYCKNCNEYLCQNCISAHLGVRLNKDHVVVKVSSLKNGNSGMKIGSSSSSSRLATSSNNSIKNSSTYCTTHNLELSLFCETCKKGVCSECFNSLHTQHNVQYYYEAIKESKLTIKFCMQRADDVTTSLKQSKSDMKRMISKIRDKGDMAISSIQQRANEMIVSVKESENKLIEQVKQIQQMKTHALKEQIDSIEKSMLAVEKAVEEAKIWLVNPTVHLFQAPQLIDEAIATSHRYTLQPLEDDAIQFVPTLAAPTAAGEGKDESERSLASGDSRLAIGRVMSSVCARQCSLMREGGSNDSSVYGTTVRFNIQARDHLGNKRSATSSEFDATVSGPDGKSFRCSVVSCHGSDDSLLTFKFKLLHEGEHQVRVKCRGMLLHGCPYAVHATRGVGYGTRASAGSRRYAFGKMGNQDGELCRPWGICSDFQGHLIVADRSNDRIQVFASDGTFLHKFGSKGSGPGQLNRPAGVATNEQHEIIVSDKDNHRIQIFSFEGAFLRCFGEHGYMNGQLNYPWDVAVNSSGQIAVTDSRNHRIQIFSSDGHFIGKYGFEGAGRARKYFDSPRGIAFMPDGRIAVTDFNNHRLVIINQDLRTAQYFGREGTNALQFMRPQGVTIDSEGNIVVADSRNHRIQVFSETGQLKAVFNRARASPTDAQQLEDGDQMDRPSGVCVTPSGDIAVVDFGHNRVLVF